MKITLFFVVLAFVYCAEAQAKPFNFLNMDPYAMHADLMNQMKSMMDPSYLKNKAGDGMLLSSSIKMVNGKPEYQVLMAEKKDGVYTDEVFKGPQ